MSRQLRVYHNIIKTRKERDQLEGMIFRNAPAVIVVHGLRANNQTHANCAIAVRNMEIMATSMGLGTCWTGFLTVAAHMSKTIGIYLEIPADRNICGALMVGHPKHLYKKSIPRKSRDIRWI
jgi:nitroreductase